MSNPIPAACWKDLCAAVERSEVIGQGYDGKLIYCTRVEGSGIVYVAREADDLHVKADKLMDACIVMITTDHARDHAAKIQVPMAGVMQ